MAIVFGFDTLASPINAGGVLPIGGPRINTIVPPPSITPSGAIPSSVPPSSTGGVGGVGSFTAFLNGFSSAVSGLGAQSSQGGAVASGSVTASTSPSTAQQLLASPVIWIVGAVLLAALIIPKGGR